jgi:hypothetical protein
MLPTKEMCLAILLVAFVCCGSATATEIEIAGSRFEVKEGKIVITADHFSDGRLPTHYQSFFFRDTTTVGEFGLISENFTIKESSKEFGDFELRKQLKLRVLHRHSSTSAMLIAEVATSMVGDVTANSNDRSLFWFEGFDLSSVREGDHVDLYGQAVIASGLYEYEIPTGDKKSVTKIVPALLPNLDEHLTSAIPTYRHPAFVNAVARKWTDASATNTTMGIPIDYAAGRIWIFVEAKNKVFDIDIARLSEGDRQWIAAQVDHSAELGRAAINRR